MKYAVCLILWALLLVSCGDSSVGDDINGNNLPVYSTVEDLPPCTAANEGEQLFVKSEGIIRVCADEKWFAAMNRLGGCTTEPLSDSSGVEILCDGDSVGVVLNGKNGANGTNAVLPDTSENGIVVLDSEKVATSLEGVSGYSQKGPFINGSKVTVIELESGRNLNQTGNTFESKIQSDDGQFKLNARMMVSQYVELHAEGYYRNEVTGKNSEAPLALYALTDVSKRDGGIVNINLLTHLEYHRVVYLVKEKKMKVFEAKAKAEEEIFNILNIASKNFFSSEDLNIAGSSEGDAALLAFSVLFQGERNVSQLTELLTNVATDMEKDGTWDNTKVRDSIADWAEEADATGKLDTIRSNVEGWGLSAIVPNFEKYIRAFWTKEYGLPACDKATVDTLLAASAKRLAGSKDRYICVDSAKVGYIWRRATELEKDTYGWEPGTDGQKKHGNINTPAIYIYDAVLGKWREMRNYEILYGFCNADVEADSARSVKQNKLYKVEEESYPYLVCKDRQWVGCSAYYADTRKYGTDVPDGTVRRGDYTSNVYVYEGNLGMWRLGWSDYEGLLMKGCTGANFGEVVHHVTEDSDEYYSCRRDSFFVDYGWYNGYQFYKPENVSGIEGDDEHWVETEQRWVKDDHEVAENTFEDNGTIYNQACPGGTLKEGNILKSSHFVCDGGFWRAATTQEEQYNFACTKETYNFTSGNFSDGTAITCDQGVWRIPLIFDYYTITVSQITKCSINSQDDSPCNKSYGSFEDPRDHQVYTTISYDLTQASGDSWLKDIGRRMGEPMVWMAQNLNFAGNADYPYLDGHNFCYRNNPNYCAQGGRFYTWAAAMNLADKWNNGNAHMAGLIGEQHQGICPEGWHIPSAEDANFISVFISGNYHDPRSAGLGVNGVRYSDYAGSPQAMYPGVANLAGFSGIYIGGTCINMNKPELTESYFGGTEYAMQWWTSDRWNGATYDNPVVGNNQATAMDVHGTDILTTEGHEKSYGLPIRCVKNYTLSSN